MSVFIIDKILLSFFFIAIFPTQFLSGFFVLSCLNQFPILKRVIVSVSNDLVTDQRVFRTCLTLEEQGFKVLLVGRKKKSNQKVNRSYKTKRLKLLFHRGFLYYAEFNIRLFILLLFSKKDILFSNDLDTLVPNYLISKLSGAKLIFDSHELFSEVPEIQNKKFVKSVWLNIENWILPKLDHVITVSPSIKTHYKKHHGIESTVVRNVPMELAIRPKKFPFSTKNKKVILYQGSVNLGRGLELMIDTMKSLEDYVLVIVGDGDILNTLEHQVLTNGLENKVKFMGKLHPKELKSYTPNAYVGISLEEDLGLNYRYALPNKLFDYVQAEIPVIVSNLPDMKELVNQYKIGSILTKRNTKELASIIENTSKKSFKENLRIAKQDLVWEKEKAKLVAVLNS